MNASIPTENPLTKVQSMFRAVQSKHPKIIQRFQIPLAWAREIMGMSKADWRQAGKGFLAERTIEHFMQETILHGPEKLSGLSFGIAKIKVAAKDELDCEDIVIIE